jgi:hypothetical protein
MALEAFVGGKHFHLHLVPCFHPNLCL